MSLVFWVLSHRIDRVSKIKLNYFPDVWPNPGPGRLPLGVEFAGVFASVESVAVSSVSELICWSLIATKTQKLSRTKTQTDLYRFYSKLLNNPSGWFINPSGAHGAHGPHGPTGRINKLAGRIIAQLGVICFQVPGRVGWDSKTHCISRLYASATPMLCFTHTKYIFGGSLASSLGRIHVRKTHHTNTVKHI